MRRASPLVPAFLVLLFPFPVFAQVIINEVAWMGTDEGGANCEWIELHNTTDQVIDLSAWTLTIENSGNATPKVLTLNETASVKYAGIGAGGYYLIARDSGSCGDLVPATSADWLGSFGNGISNSGAKLILKNGTQEEDVVDSKTGWEATKSGVGGKNTSPKETPQWTGTSWITASPTPRGLNHAEPLQELPEEEEGVVAPVVTVGGTAPLVPVTHPIAQLYVNGGPARIVSAGADTLFSAIAYDSVGTVRKNAEISWAFGDGGQEKGEEVSYAYKKPGTYTAVVRARDKGVSSVALIPIIVTTAGVTVTSVSEEGITLSNETDALADISGWKISIGTKTTRLPKDTVIARQSSAFFPFENLRTASSSEIALQFPNGRIAHAFVQPEEGKEKLYPSKTLAVTASAHAQEAVLAPAVQESLVTAGAPLAQESQTVSLKEHKGVFGSVGAFVFGAVASIAGIFSR